MMMSETDVWMCQVDNAGAFLTPRQIADFVARAPADDRARDVATELRERLYTGPQNCLILELWHAGVRDVLAIQARIATEFGVLLTKNLIWVRIHRLGLGGQGQNRKCLCCGRIFRSKGRGNRLCQRHNN